MVLVQHFVTSKEEKLQIMNFDFYLMQTMFFDDSSSVNIMSKEGKVTNYEPSFKNASTPQWAQEELPADLSEVFPGKFKILLVFSFSYFMYSTLCAGEGKSHEQPFIYWKTVCCVPARMLTVAK